MLEQISEWQLGGILVFVFLLKIKWIFDLVKWKWILLFIFFCRCLDNSVYTCTTARYMNYSVWNMMNRTTYLFSFPCPNIHMQPYKIQPRIYRGFIYILVILKVERCGEIFLLIHSILRHRIYRGFIYILLILKVAHCRGIFLLIHIVLRHRTSREEMKEITLEHMTHITSILQVITSTASSNIARQRRAQVF